MASQKIKFAQVAKELFKVNQLLDGGKIPVIYGKSQAIGPILERWLVDAFQKLSCRVEKRDVTKGRPDDLLIDLQQPSLFAEKKVVFLFGMATNKKLLDVFADAKISSPVVIFHSGHSIPKKLTGSRFHPIGFSELGNADLRPFIQFVGGYAGVKLSDDAAKYLIDWIGADPAGLTNEIQKLALIFADPKSANVASLGVKDIEPHCSALKADKAFEISNLALKQDKIKLKAVIEDLIKRGEHPLVLLSLIHRFVRQCVEIKADPALSSLPEWIKKDYVKFVRSKKASSLALALQKCQEIDQACKSGGAQKNAVELLYRPFAAILSSH